MTAKKPAVTKTPTATSAAPKRVRKPAAATKTTQPLGGNLDAAAFAKLGNQDDPVFQKKMKALQAAKKQGQVLPSPVAMAEAQEAVNQMLAEQHAMAKESDRLKRLKEIGKRLDEIVFALRQRLNNTLTFRVPEGMMFYTGYELKAMPTQSQVYPFPKVCSAEDIWPDDAAAGKIPETKSNFRYTTGYHFPNFLADARQFINNERPGTPEWFNREIVTKAKLLAMFPPLLKEVVGGEQSLPHSWVEMQTVIALGLEDACEMYVNDVTNGEFRPPVDKVNENALPVFNYLGLISQSSLREELLRALRELKEFRYKERHATAGSKPGDFDGDVM